MACLFGHKWKGCKCEKCGKLRDSDHIFQPVEGKCEEKCKGCGIAREKHNYVNGFCARCGKQSDRPIVPDTLSVEEIQELTYSVDAYNEYNGCPDYSLLSRALNGLGTFSGCEKNPDLIKVGKAARAGLQSGSFSAEEADLLIFVARKTKEAFEGPAFADKQEAILKRIDRLNSASEKIEKAVSAFRETAGKRGN